MQFNCNLNRDISLDLLCGGIQKNIYPKNYLVSFKLNQNETITGSNPPFILTDKKSTIFLIFKLLNISLFLLCSAKFECENENECNRGKIFAFKNIAIFYLIN